MFVEDASEDIRLRLDARSVLIYKSKVSIELCSARSLVVLKWLWFDVDPWGVSSVT